MPAPPRSRLFVSLALSALLGCSRASTNGASTAQSGDGATKTQTSATASASADGLTLVWELGPEVVPGRVPLRTVRLRFRNTGPKPLRIYLPQSEIFRSQISDLSFASAGGPRFFEPAPHPHGYVVTEIDFPEIAPGEERVFTQTFTLDPIGAGHGGPARRPGFGKGTSVTVTWTYQNRTTSWPGGANTLDGVTKPLFGGGPIPGIWTGKLDVRGSWTVPD